MQPVCYPCTEDNTKLPSTSREGQQGVRRNEKRLTDAREARSGTTTIRPPSDWPRCHAYLPQKRRFCRQEPIVSFRTPVAVSSLDSISVVGSDGEVSSSKTEKVVTILVKYCGNHQFTHLPTNHVGLSNGSSVTRMVKQRGSCSQSTKQPNVCRRRIPCPIDSSHTIWEDQREKHRNLCPKLKIEREQERLECFQRNVNTGGHGAMEHIATGLAAKLASACACALPESATKSTGLDSNTSIPASDSSWKWAVQLARCVIQVYRSILTSGSVRHDGVLGISLMDMATPDLIQVLESAVDHYRIKTGGHRHLHQQASLIGHLRRVGAIPRGLDRVSSSADLTEMNPDIIAAAPPPNEESKIGDTWPTSVAQYDNEQPLVVLEVGAGRGITGLLLAGVAQAYYRSHRQRVGASPDGSDAAISSTSPLESTPPVPSAHLIMVDRGCTRSKADTILRRAPSLGPAPSLDLGFSWSRVTCDLSHLNLRKLLGTHLSAPGSASTTRNRRLIVIAKHLCGKGTDIALKSIAPVRSCIAACAFATCCHGLCTWEDYVGRDFLGRVMTDHAAERSALSQSIQEERLAPFGKREFDLLCRWSAGTVSCCTARTEVSAECTDDDHSGDVCGDNGASAKCRMNSSKICNDPLNISRIASAVKMDPSDLGRACQRLIDFGRREYLRSQILNATNERNENLQTSPELVSYVPEDVTPQNALLIGWR